MADQILFQSGGVEITPTIARFNNSSYQIANIGSVAMHSRRSMNQLALFLIILSFIVLGAALTLITTPYKDYILPTVIIAAVTFIVGIVVQNKRPVVTYTLLFKTSSGDVQALWSQDRDHVTKVKQAIEHAFALRT